MKSVVVVDTKNNVREIFEGKDIEIINKPAYGDTTGITGYYGPELLIVRDAKKELAVFSSWIYWKKLE